MSCNEWERGTITIPTKAWKPFRDALCAAYNKRQVLMYELALKFHGMLEQQKKLAKRGTFDLTETWNKLCQKSPSIYPKDLHSHQDMNDMEAALFGPVGHRTGKLLLPKKKNFPPAVSTKVLEYDAEMGTISLNAAEHSVTWTVHENNHAVETAHESYMGKALFDLLAKIQWTRGSGGTIVGNNEYNRENAREGGGANYVTYRFAMQTKADKEALAQHRQSSWNRRTMIRGF